MGKFEQSEFDKFIIDQDVVGLFDKPVKLNSGRLANWYVNWRDVSEDVYLFDKLTDFVVAYVDELNLKPDCFFGVPEGATKLSLITQFKWAKAQPNYGLGVYPLAMARGKAKEHGELKDQYFIGTPKGRTIVLEDVTTTGSSMLKTLDILLELNVPVLACIGITNRNEVRDDKKTVKDVVEERGITYHAMSNAIDLLPLVIDKLQSDEGVVTTILKYFENYGTGQLKLLENNEKNNKEC